VKKNIMILPNLLDEVHKTRKRAQSAPTSRIRAAASLPRLFVSKPYSAQPSPYSANTSPRSVSPRHKKSSTFSIASLQAPGSLPTPVSSSSSYQKLKLPKRISRRGQMSLQNSNNSHSEVDELPEFKVGQIVAICGLVKIPSFNNQLAEVVLPSNKDGRYPVKIIATEQQIAVRPQNLKLIRNLKMVNTEDTESDYLEDNGTGDGIYVSEQDETTSRDYDNDSEEDESPAGTPRVPITVKSVLEDRVPSIEQSHTLEESATVSEVEQVPSPNLAPIWPVKPSRAVSEEVKRSDSSPELRDPTSDSGQNVSAETKSSAKVAEKKNHHTLHSSNADSFERTPNAKTSASAEKSVKTVDKKATHRVPPKKLSNKQGVGSTNSARSSPPSVPRKKAILPVSPRKKANPPVSPRKKKSSPVPPKKKAGSRSKLLAAKFSSSLHSTTKKDSSRSTVRRTPSAAISRKKHLSVKVSSPRSRGQSKSPSRSPVATPRTKVITEQTKLIRQLVGQNERMLNKILTDKEVATHGQQQSIEKSEGKSNSKNNGLSPRNIFAVGDRVLMHGLVKSKSLNGKVAEITQPVNRRGLHRVKVLESQTALYVKPKNLKFDVEDGLVAI